jgi:hypothetical protein
MEPSVAEIVECVFDGLKWADEEDTHAIDQRIVNRLADLGLAGDRAAEAVSIVFPN